MKPKEKAEELISKFVSISLSQYVDLVDGIRIRLSKECALIAVDEIIEVTSPNCDRYEPYYLELKAEMTQQYWQEVKQEIEKF